MNNEKLIKEYNKFNKLFSPLQQELMNRQSDILAKTQIYQEVIHNNIQEIAPAVSITDLVPYKNGCLVHYDLCYQNFTARELLYYLSIEEMTMTIEEFTKHIQ